MVRHTPAARKSLLFLPVLGLTASPAAQAASSLSLQSGNGGGDGTLGLGGEVFPLGAPAVSSTQSLAPATPIPERSGHSGESLSVEWADGGLALDHGAAPADQPLVAGELGSPALEFSLDSQSIPPTVSQPQRLAQVLPTPGATQTQVEFTPDSATFEISGGTQAGGNLFHRFDQLDLSAGEVANFLSQPQTEAIFSQIGGAASSIDGLLKISGSSADLFVINPAGILLGPNARLDLSGSFVATTADQLQLGDRWLDLLNEGFTAQTASSGELTGLGFSAAAAGGMVANQGSLAVGQGQSLGLLGQAVVNSGSLSAPGGEITLLASQGGQRVSLGGGLLNVELGRIEPEWSEATPPTLQFPAAEAEATGLQRNADGSISLSAGTLRVSGQVDVSLPISQARSQANGAGGQVNLLGETVELVNAVVDASGASGGKIQVGGTFQGQALEGQGRLLTAQRVAVDGSSRLSADAIAQGDGGQVIVWSDQATQFAGQASAQGGSPGGNGGLVETSGKQTLDVTGARVDASAAQGLAGDWLLDPTDIVIANGGLGFPLLGTFNPLVTGFLLSTIAPSTIEAVLNGGTNVTITTAGGIGGNGDISLNDSINQTGGGGASLTLTGRRFNRASGAQIDLTSTGALTFNLNQVNPEAVAPTSSIQNAIDAIGTTSGPSQINLGAGTYQGPAGGSLVTINKDVTIDGGDRANSIVSGGNNARNFWVTAGTTATLRNLTIMNGQTSATESGAGILNEGNLTLDGTTVQNNVAGLDGGGIDSSASTSSLLVTGNTIFLRNQAGVDGGGLFVGGNTQFLQGEIVENTAGNIGGGIFSEGITTIDATSFRLNNATLNGGAIHSVNAAAPLVIQDSSFVDNQAGNNGGALFVNGNTQISGTGIDANTAGNDGGGIYNTGDLILNSSSVSQNGAVRGGGIATIGNTSSITGTNFSIIDNTAADDGGGVYSDVGELSFTSGSFERNSSSQNGGGIRTGGPLTLRNSGVRDNSALLGGGIFTTNTNVDIEVFQFRGNSANNDGGGLRLSNSVATISSGSFENNQAQFGGGLEASGTGNVQITNVVFNDNVSTRFGGAIQNNGTVVMTVNDSQFSNNQATLDGGAIQNNGTLAVNRSSILSNSASRYGAGIYNDGILNVVGTTFLGGQSISGSGIFNTTTLTVANSLFDSNIATRGITFGDGAAIHNTPNSTLLVDNTTFQNNQADDLGGAISSLRSDVRITGSTFENNRSNEGGGLNHNVGSLVITDSSFLGNVAQINGGGLDLSGVTSASIQQTLIQNNQADQLGGGINLGGASNLSLDTVTLNQNRATTGGGLKTSAGQIFSGIINIENSTITNNEAVVNGGGLDVDAAASSSVNLSNSTLSANQAGTDGGAIAFSSNTTFNITNSTLAQNQSSNLGGAIAAFGPGNLTNVTVSSNTSGSQGGGLFATTAFGPMQLNNTIIAQNQSPIGTDISGGVTDGGNNLIGISDGSSGLTNSALVGTAAAPINPLLAPLGDYGGLTQTMALLPGSPALDAGSSAIPADQRGVARVNAADIGAFESQGFVVTAQAGTPQTAEVNTAFAAPLTVAISSPFGEPVDGGLVNFAAPTAGASIAAPTPISVAITGGTAQLSVAANAVEGLYDVQATAAGISPVAFALTNTPAPPIPDPPVIDPPVVDPPVIDPPVIDPPVVDPPVIDPPVIDPPAIDPPVIDPPLAEPEPPVLPTLTERPIDLPQPGLPDSPLLTGNSPLSVIDGSAIQAIDGIFSGEYIRYWQEGATEGSPIAQAIADSGSAPGASVAETRELLREAATVHGTNSAVVYALFVPQDKAADDDFGAGQVANMALARRLQTEEERDDDQLLLMLVPAAGEVITQLVDATQQDVIQQGRLFRMAVSDPEDDQSYRPLAQQFASWLVEPIKSEMERLELDNVMYALAPGLRSIPLSAMMDGDEFVIERYGLSLIPSMALLESDFGASSASSQTLAAGANEFEQLEDLPAVEIELNAIANRRESVEVLFNEDFTQANLVSTQNESQAKTLHLATHAEFNAGDLDSSYLKFWDGRLTLNDISQLGWNELELLILSACQTAISSPEAELGFAGLAAAAGVESTMASLWSVSDIGTLALMSEFHGQLADEPLRFEALRQAQLAMMRGETAIANQTLRTGRGDIELPPDWPLPEQANFSHPFYWAGFALVGNPWW